MFKTEMHLHTVGNSFCGKETAAKIIELYKAAGYNAIFCTNHLSKHIFNNYFSDKSNLEEKIYFYLKEFLELKKLGAQNGIDIFFGMELALGADSYEKHSNRHCAELLIYGVTVDEFIKYNISMCDMDYEKFFAFAQEQGWLVVQSHPFRKRTKRVDVKYLNGLEAYNSHGHNKNFLAERRAKIHNLIKTAGSDFHYAGGEVSGLNFHRRIKDEKDLVQALKEGGAEIIKRKGKNAK